MIIGSTGIHRLNISVAGIKHLPDGPKSSHIFTHPWDGVAVDPNDIYLYIRGFTTKREDISIKLDVKSSVWSPLTPKDTKRKKIFDYSSTFMFNNTLYSLGGEVYGFYGGVDRIRSSIECLNVKDPFSKWTTCGPSFPHGIYKASSCTMNGWVWVTGGINEMYHALSTTYRWQPGRDQWQQMADMNEKRNQHPQVTDGISLYVIGGYHKVGNIHEYTSGVELYNASTNTWYLLARLPEGRAMSGAVFLPWGQLLLAGGKTRRKHNDRIILLYSIAENIWIKSDVQLTKDVSRHGVALLSPKWQLHLN